MTLEQQRTTQVFEDRARQLGSLFDDPAQYSDAEYVRVRSDQ